MSNTTKKISRECQIQSIRSLEHIKYYSVYLKIKLSNILLFYRIFKVNLAIYKYIDFI